MAFLLANFKMTLRNKQVLFWSLFFPIMMMLVFGVMFSSGSDRQFDVGIVNNSRAKSAKELVKVVKKVGAFNVTQKNESVEKQALEDGKRVAVIIIPTSLKDIPKQNPTSKAFDKKPVVTKPIAVKTTKISLLYNENKAQDAQIVGTVIEQVTGRFNQKITKVPQLLSVKKLAYKARDLKYIDFLLPGLIAMSLMMGGVVGIAAAIATMRERGVLKSLLLTPMKPASFFTSQLITRCTIALIQTAIMIGLGILLFGLHFFGSVLTLSIVVIIGATVFLIFGLIMSGIAKSAETVEPMTRAIIMPMIFLSGVFFPLDVMPTWLQPISKSLPLYYMADALRKVVSEGATLAGVQTDILVLLTWGIVGFVIASVTFKWE